MKTKKIRFNNLLKFGVFLFGISLLLWNCENHNDESLIEPQNEIKVDTVFSIDIDAKVSKLKSGLIDKIIDYQDNYSIKNGKILKHNFKQRHGSLSNKVYSVYKEGDTYPIIILPFLKKGKGNKLLIGYVKNDTYQYKIFKKNNTALIGNAEGVEKDILKKLDLYFEVIYKTNKNSNNRRGTDCEYTMNDRCSMTIWCNDDWGFSVRTIDICGKMDNDGDGDDEWPAPIDPIDPIDLDPIDIDPIDDWEFGGGNEENSNIDYFSVDFLTNECAKKVIITELLSGVDASFINEVFSLFNNANIHLDIRNTNLPVNQNAATSTPTNSQVLSGSFTINIGINNSYLNNNPTKLSIAAITIHELNHAQLTYYWAKGTLLTQHPSYTTLNTALTNYSLNPSSSNRDAVNDQMHIAMVDSIESMAESLFEYSDNTNTNTTLNYCKKLITGTLYGTAAANIINANHSNNSNYLNECNTINVNEQNNDSQSQGNDC